jgi:hypothetical protein
MKTMTQYEIIEEHFTKKYDRATIEVLHREIQKKKKLKFLGEGSTRTVYQINDRFVLKIPCPYAIHGGPVRANLAEILLSRRFQGYDLFCTTKPYQFGNQIVLLAETTKQLFNRNNMPTEEHAKNMRNPKIPKIIKSLMYDGTDQLGTNRRGNIVCFDFGLERQVLDLLPMGVSKDFTKNEKDRLINRLPSLDTLLSRI